MLTVITIKDDETRVSGFRFEVTNSASSMEEAQASKAAQLTQAVGNYLNSQNVVKPVAVPEASEADQGSAGDGKGQE